MATNDWALRIKTTADAGDGYTYKANARTRGMALRKVLSAIPTGVRGALSEIKIETWYDVDHLGAGRELRNTNAPDVWQVGTAGRAAAAVAVIEYDAVRVTCSKCGLVAQLSPRPEYAADTARDHALQHPAGGQLVALAGAVELIDDDGDHFHDDWQQHAHGGNVGRGPIGDRVEHRHSGALAVHTREIEAAS